MIDGHTEERECELHIDPVTVCPYYCMIHNGDDTNQATLNSGTCVLSTLPMRWQAASTPQLPAFNQLYLCSLGRMLYVGRKQQQATSTSRSAWVACLHRC